MTRPVRTTSRSASSLVVQNGRVSSRSLARLTALITEPVAPDAAHSATSTPRARATAEPACVAGRAVLRQVEHVQDALRRDRLEQVGQRVVRAWADQPEQSDEQDHAREERERRAVCDLLGETETVVGEKLLARTLQRGDPLGRRAAGRASSGLAQSR